MIDSYMFSGFLAFWLGVDCGAGTYTRFLATRKIKVVGLDYSLPAIKKAKSRDVQRNYWGVADIKNQPLKSNTFDGACFVLVSCKSWRILRQPSVIYTALLSRKDACGWAWLNTWCLSYLLGHLLRWVSKWPIHLRHKSPGELRRVMESVGFDSVQLLLVADTTFPLAAFSKIAGESSSDVVPTEYPLPCFVVYY